MGGLGEGTRCRQGAEPAQDRAGLLILGPGSSQSLHGPAKAFAGAVHADGLGLLVQRVQAHGSVRGLLVAAWGIALALQGTGEHTNGVGPDIRVAAWRCHQGAAEPG